VNHPTAHQSSHDYTSNHPPPAAIRSTPSRRSRSRAPSSPYAAPQPTTLSQTGISIRVNKEPSFSFLNPKGRDCHECVIRGYKPGSKTQLHTHIKERHLEDAQTKSLLHSTCPFCNTGSFTRSSVLADHIISAHTNSGLSSASLSSSPTPGPSPVNTPSYSPSVSMSMSPMIGGLGQALVSTRSYGAVNTIETTGNEAAYGVPSHSNVYGSHLAPPVYPQAPHMNNGQQSFAPANGYQPSLHPGYGYPPNIQDRNYQTYRGMQ
jgi:hypothetical protein